MGYLLVPRWHLENLALSMHLKSLFQYYGISTVLDVGANEGQYRRFLRYQVEFTGIIHSFEPIPQLAASMEREALRDPAWHVHNYALGTESAETTLNIMARNTFSSLRQPELSAPEEFVKSNTIKDQIQVSVRRLDDIVSDLKGVTDGNVYLKVDTQGFDLEVLKGAQHLLPRISALQFELAIQRIYQGLPSYLETLETVNRMGFDLSGMYPVPHDRPLRAVEFDCVMVRQPSKETRA
jgi:FkbM family methyltransferase